MHPKIIEALEKISKESNYEKGTYKGFLCIAQRMVAGNAFFGNINGYVIIPEDSEFHGDSGEDIDCHGGITFAGNAKVLFPHEPDVKDTDWALGFDTAHADDIMPFQYMTYMFAGDMLNTQDRILEISATYKDMNFVKNECKKIVDQIA